MPTKLSLFATIVALTCCIPSKANERGDQVKLLLDKGEKAKIIDNTHHAPKNENHQKGQMSNQELIKRISLVDPTSAETMTNNPTTFEKKSLPFYQKYQLLIAITNLRTHPHAFHYADDGSRIFVLHSTPEHIYAVNEKEQLQLDAKQVSAYLRFYFDNVTGQRITLVEQPDDVPWFKGASSESDLKTKMHAESLILRPMKVTATDDGFDVAFTAVAAKKLIEIQLKLKKNGHVENQNQKVLIETIPVVEFSP